MNFEAHQAKLISQVEQGILQVAAEEERKLDEKLKSLETLGKKKRSFFSLFLIQKC